MQTVTTLPILQTVSDATTHYVGLQPAISGATNAQYVNRNISFTPASNTLSIGVNVNFLPNSISGLALSDSAVTGEKIAPLNRLIERAKIISGGIGGNVNIDVLESSVYYVTGYPVANITFNLRGNSNFALDGLLNPGQSISTVFMITQNVVQYSANISIDGVFQTANIKYSGNAKPAYSASLSREIIDVYAFSTIKVGQNAYTILSSNTLFGVG